MSKINPTRECRYTAVIAPSSVSRAAARLLDSASDAAFSNASLHYVTLMIGFRSNAEKQLIHDPDRLRCENTIALRIDVDVDRRTGTANKQS
jgi:hypothetical protein